MSRYGKAGMEIWRNSKLSSRLKQEQKEGKILSRKEWLFIKTTDKDLLILIPYFIWFCLPIIGYTMIIFAALYPAYLPSTFITPAVSEKIQVEDKQYRNRICTPLFTYFSNQLPSEEERKKWQEKEDNGHPNLILSQQKLILTTFNLNNLKRQELLQIGGFLQLQLLQVLPAFLIKYRVTQQLQFLQEDDHYLQAELPNLQPSEKHQACLARGLYPSPKTPHDHLLNQWLQLSSQDVLLAFFWSVSLLHNTTKKTN
uniref:Letm1 RBD domain-containing protein n=1 Tax=Arcella intermedia TaxID=1963864 RepID=A0A6B2LEK0_9EUKA